MQVNEQQLFQSLKTCSLNIYQFPGKSLRKITWRYKLFGIRPAMVPATQAHVGAPGFKKSLTEGFCVDSANISVPSILDLYITWLLEIAVAAFFCDHLPFSLPHDNDCLWHCVCHHSWRYSLVDLCQNSEELTTLELEELARHGTACGCPEDFETEEATANSWLENYIKPRCPWAFNLLKVP